MRGWPMSQFPLMMMMMMVVLVMMVMIKLYMKNVTKRERPLIKYCFL